MSFLDILAVIISIIHFGIAETVCFGGGADRPKPVPAHCAYIIAHLPSTAYHPMQPPGQLLSTSSPFHLDATFRYKSCVIVLRALSIRPIDQVAQRDPIVLPERNLFQNWHELWFAAEEVRTTCCDNSLWGYDERPDPNEERGLLYTLMHAYREDKRLQVNIAITRKRMLIERGSRFQQNLSGLDQPLTVDIIDALPQNPFEKAIYDL